MFRTVGNLNSSGASALGRSLKRASFREASSHLSCSITPPADDFGGGGMLEIEKSSTFGHHEVLTTRLASLVRQYPAGPGIIKEFIQNADDAGATRLDVVM